MSQCALVRVLGVVMCGTVSGMHLAQYHLLGLGPAILLCVAGRSMNGNESVIARHVMVIHIEEEGLDDVGRQAAILTARLALARDRGLQFGDMMAWAREEGHRAMTGEDIAVVHDPEATRRTLVARVADPILRLARVQAGHDHTHHIRVTLAVAAGALPEAKAEACLTVEKGGAIAGMT